MNDSVKRQLPRFITLGGTLLLLCAIAAAVWAEVTPDEQSLLRQILNEHPALILSAAFLFPLAVAFGVFWVFGQYIEPLRKLVDEVKVTNLVNPPRRLLPAGSTRVRELSGAINRMLERIQELQTHVDIEVQASRRQAEEEKNVLEALLQDFPDAVVVCNIEGQILLYNRRARDVLGAGGGAPGAPAPGGGFLGLGRSVFAFVDRDLIVHALEMLHRGTNEGKETRNAHFVTKGPHEALLRVEVSPVPGAPGEYRGYVLLLQDISLQLGHDMRRDALLISLTERLRSSLATVRTAVELLIDHPGMDENRRIRLTGVIRDESLSLSGYMESHRADHAEYFRSQWPLEEMACDDVAAAFRQYAEQSLDVRITMQPSPEHAWVRVDSFTLVQALVQLTREMKNATGAIEFWIRPLREGPFVNLDLLWRGKTIPAATLREWEQSRIRIAGEEISVTLADVLKRHDAELWCGADPDGTRSYLRLVLPVSDIPDREKRWRAAVTVTSRPEFYDFDLFTLHANSLPLAERPLGEIPCTAFDTETTGLRPSEGDEIVSIGAVRIVNGRMLREETFDQLVDPGRPLPRESQQVHGIDDEMLRGQPGITGVLPAFDRFVHETVLIGHNAAFDMKFFQLKEEATGVRLRMPVLDTLLLSSVVHPHHEDHSIEGIAARLGVNIVGRHTALGDAIVTGELFLKLIPLLEDKGIRTLREALQASRTSYLARVKY